jgi:2,4'-dihydroxyacetophenone dioxygenase
MKSLGLPPIVGHVDDASTPFIDMGSYRFKMLRADLASGQRVMRIVFEPDFRSPTHRHSGWTLGYTVSGAWGYEEYGSRYEAGSLIHEPAGSLHTLVVFADNTEPTDVIFVSNGANVDLDDDGNVLAISDTETLLVQYYEACDARGLPRPTHIEA